MLSHNTGRSCQGRKYEHHESSFDGSCLGQQTVWLNNSFNIALHEERLDLLVLLLEAGANINSPPASCREKRALQLAVKQ